MLLQYADLNGDCNLLLVLLTLANNCELQPHVRNPTLKIQAAEHRQQLFVEMINEGEPIHKNCAVCQKDMSAHKPSSPEPMQFSIVVSYCFHLFQKTCLQSLGGNVSHVSTSSWEPGRCETCTASGTGP